MYSMDDVMFKGGEMHLILQGRITFLLVVGISFFFMLGMLLDAYRYYCRKMEGLILDGKMKIMRRDEILDIAIYALLFIGILISFLQPWMFVHVVFNVLMTAMIARTYYVYSNFMHYSEHSSKKLLIFMDIDKKIKSVIEKERNNPLYMSNSTLDDVAGFLNIDRNDLSDYLYEKLDTNFSTWMSDVKITHFCNQLMLTNRKISELSVACGYNNASSLSRAFKAKYKMTPSEWREIEKNE
jgi:AraC-like DNA-binding protein